MFLQSCQNDDFQQDNHSQQNKLNVKIEDKTLEKLMNDKKFSSAFCKISKQKYKIPNSVTAKTVMEDDYDFIISDDISAKVITTESLISYTFHISRENDSLENSNSFENLVVLTDSLDTVRAYIIKYNLLSEPVYVNEHNSYIIDAEKEVTPITYNNSQAKISVIGSDGCTVLTLMCPYEHPHPAGAGCIAEDRGDLYWEADSSGCGGGGGGSSSGGWTGSGNSDSGSSPGNGNSDGMTSGGGGNNNGNNNTVSPLVTTPVGLDGKPLKKECAKIAKVLNDFPDFKQKLLDLASEAPTATNEKVIVLHKDGTDAEYTGQSGIVPTPPNPSSKYTAMAHNHDGQNTYSVFSSGDFGFIGLVDVAYDKLDIDKFVSFLVTAKGTRYAFTINSKAKFRSFYEFVKWKRSDTPFPQVNQYLQMMKQRQEVLDKYFEFDKPHVTYPLIKETSTNTSMDLLLFVKFLEEADMGISVFEVDENFENFKEVKKNPNDPTQVTKSNCK